MTRLCRTAGGARGILPRGASIPSWVGASQIPSAPDINFGFMNTASIKETTKGFMPCSHILRRGILGGRPIHRPTIAASVSTNSNRTSFRAET